MSLFIQLQILAFSFLLIIVADTSMAAQNMSLPNVTIVTTGGTIAEKRDSKSGGVVPAVSGKDLIAAVPQLAKIANINVVNFANIDSSQMTPDIWKNLSKKVDEILKNPTVKGVVVTHGTDTMAEGAFFLDLTLNSKKPVVFVGAMRDASELSPDGPANLLDAVTQVCSDVAQDWGVTVTLNQYINAARNVVKTQTDNVQTFKSGAKGYLGYIAMGRVIHYNQRPERQHFPLQTSLPKVVIVADYAGSDGSLIRYAVDSGAEGIVIDAVGAGNVNKKMNKAIKYAIRKKVPVVITTRVYHGPVLPIYGDEGGGETLLKEGAILGGDLKAPKARILLMLALPHVGYDITKLKRIFSLH